MITSKPRLPSESTWNEDTGWVWQCDNEDLFENGVPYEDLGYNSSDPLDAASRPAQGGSAQMTDQLKPLSREELEKLAFSLSGSQYNIPLRRALLTIDELGKENVAHRKALSRFITTVNPAGYDDGLKAEEAFEQAIQCVIADRELKAQAEPGTAAAIVRAVFDLAEAECGHNPASARHGLTTIRKWIASAKTRIDELEKERDEAVLQLAAEKVVLGISRNQTKDAFEIVAKQTSELVELEARQKKLVEALKLVRARFEFSPDGRCWICAVHKEHPNPGHVRGCLWNEVAACWRMWRKEKKTPNR